MRKAGLALAGAGLRRIRPFASRLPVTWGGWIVAGLFVALGTSSVYGIVIALRRRTAPPVRAVTLAFPPGSGVYLVVNGGGDINTNSHLMTLDARIPRFREWRGQSYGVDIVKLGAFGLRARGMQPDDPGAYRIHGARVFAPCAGQGCSPWTGCPTCRCPRWTATIWRATM